MAILAEFCGSDSHSFWPDEVSLLDGKLFDVGAAINPAHLTDVYLLGLSVRKGGKLATLDRHIPSGEVVGGGEATEVIPS